MHLLSSFSAFMDIMREHNVDFIGGDFKMSPFSTVGDVFTDQEFSAPGISLLWGLGALEEPNRECAGFLIMPKRPYEWRVHSHGCYKFDNALLGLGPRDQSAHLPVFLHLRNTNLPRPSSIMRSDQAQQRRFERRHCKERMQRRRSSRKCTLLRSFLTRHSECLFSTLLRQDFLTQCYTLSTQSQ